MSEPTLQQVLDKIAKYKSSLINWHCLSPEERLHTVSTFCASQAIDLIKIHKMGDQLSKSDQAIFEAEIEKLRYAEYTDSMYRDHCYQF